MQMAKQSSGGLVVVQLAVLFLAPLLLLANYSSAKLVVVHDAAEDQYAVIFDCGTTGSRVHVYRFNQNLELLPAYGDHLEFYDYTLPGLSSYADDPVAAANSLKRLLDEAVEVVPQELRSRTPVRVGATAGLRTLEGDTADRILEEVRKLIKDDGNLKFEDDWVAILDGTLEGTYMWVTVNYALDTLGKPYYDSIATIDLGGGAVIVSYAISDESANNAPQLPPNETYVLQKNFKGTHYNLYVHSYLNYGAKAARAEILKLTKSTNPCIVKGYDGTFSYNGVDYKATAPPSGPNVKECLSLARKVLNLDAPCSYEKCTFDGVWNGGLGPGLRHVYLSSSFFWTAQEGKILGHDSIGGAFRPKDYINAAKNVCATNYEDIPTEYPDTYVTDVPYLCMDLIYQYALLVDGFGFSRSRKVTAVKDVTYKNWTVSAEWPLGDAIDVISSSSSKVMKRSSADI